MNILAMVEISTNDEQDLLLLLDDIILENSISSIEELEEIYSKELSEQNVDYHKLKEMDLITFYYYFYESNEPIVRFNNCNITNSSQTISLQNIVDLLKLDCNESIYFAALKECHNNITQAINLLKSDYIVVYGDDYIEEWLENVLSDMESNYIKNLILNHLDKNSLKEELLFDFSSFDNDLYISWS